MELVCVAEVTAEHQIKVDDSIKNKLHPGDRVKIKIETMVEDKEKRRLKAVQQLREISLKSKLGLYNNLITREDAYFL